MGRRPQAGRDLKIIQGHRRDAFFAKMRQKGGVPRLPSDAPATTAEEAPSEPSPEEVAEEPENQGTRG